MITVDEVQERLLTKASQSRCKHKISAVGFDKEGRMIGSTFNVSRFDKLGGSIHAEMRLMARYGQNLETIVIARVNKSGEFLPIDPCDACAEKAEELGITIQTVSDLKKS